MFFVNFIVVLEVLLWFDDEVLLEFGFWIVFVFFGVVVGVGKIGVFMLLFIWEVLGIFCFKELLLVNELFVFNSSFLVIIRNNIKKI